MSNFWGAVQNDLLLFIITTSTRRMRWNNFIFIKNLDYENGRIEYFRILYGKMVKSHKKLLPIEFMQLNFARNLMSFYYFLILQLIYNKTCSIIVMKKLCNFKQFINYGSLFQFFNLLFKSVTNIFIFSTKINRFHLTKIGLYHIMK